MSMHAWGLTACLTLELFPVLQPLCWCCVECAIHHEWDVRKEQHSVHISYAHPRTPLLVNTTRLWV